MAKFLFFIMYATVVFFLPNNYWILTLIPVNIFIMLAAHLFARPSIRRVVAGVLKFLPFILLTFLFNLWLDNFENATWISCKLLVVCQITMTYASTTSNLEVAVTIQTLCMPLQLFRIDTEDIKILVCVALSLIPTLRHQLSEIRLACAAKHMPMNLRNAKPILSHFFTLVFARIEQIEAALLAKGYRES